MWIPNLTFQDEWWMNDDGTGSVYDDTGWYLVSVSWHCLVLCGAGSAKGLYACILGKNGCYRCLTDRHTDRQQNIVLLSWGGRLRHSGVKNFLRGWYWGRSAVTSEETKISSWLPNTKSFGTMQSVFFKWPNQGSENHSCDNRCLVLMWSNPIWGYLNPVYWDILILHFI